jgi:hypothetical protein
MKHLVVATTIVALAVAIGFGVVRAVENRDPKPRVIAVGDSITWLQTVKWHTLDAALSGKYAFTSASLPGKRIDEIEPTLDHAVAGSKADDRIVLGVGTNDMEQSRAGWEAPFDRMWNTVSQHDCVVYVTVGELPGLPVGAAINRRIRNLAAQHPNVRIWDWNAYLHGPAGNDPAHPLRFDPVHPTEDGARAISRGVRHALDSCPGS